MGTASTFISTSTIISNKWETMESTDETRPRGRQFQAVSRQKIIPNLPILRINHEFKGIMVNMGRIYRELRNFQKIS